MTATDRPGADDTVAVVAALPDCDIHRQMFGSTVPAAYDAATNLPGAPWAYMCADCFPRFGPGRLGLGVGQKLEVTS